MDTKVAVYTRLSQDRDGTKTSTKQQEADLRRLAKTRGWRVTKVFTDNGISAFSGAARPAYEQLIAAVDAGEVDGVLAWRIDRLGRRTVEVAGFLERVKERGGFVATADGLDSSTAIGKTVMEISGSFAALESENTRSRVKRAKLESAQAGRPSGGGRRPFGYSADGMTIIESEAVHVREATTHILAGGSLHGLERAWNDRVIGTSQGKRWSGATLRRMLLSPRIAGLRTYKGETIGQAAWPAIITVADHEQLRAMLTDPGRRTSRPGAVKYLLTGSAFCGRCGSPLVAAPFKGGRSYACRSAKKLGSCGGVRIKASALDEHVTETILDALDSPALTRMRRAAGRADGRVGDLTRALRRDEAALEQLSADFYVEHRLNRREFLRAHDALVARIAGTRSELGTRTAGRTVAALPSAGAELRAMWAAADLGWHRALIAAVVERIDVGPSKARGRTDLDRVAVAMAGTT